MERFLEFKAFYKKTGSENADMIENLLWDRGDIGDCRGQGYDNGANMSGRVKGVQAQISKKNHLATFLPCASHTLNLVGVNASQTSPEVAKFLSAFIACIHYVLEPMLGQWK